MIRKIRKMQMTGQDFPNYSSSEGAPSDCSVEAWPSHSENAAPVRRSDRETAHMKQSEVEVDVDHEENLQLVGLELGSPPGPRTRRIAHGPGSPRASG